jgi:hypothetical protein
MKTKILFVAVCIGSILFLLKCTNPTQTTGNGSGSGNAVVGKLYQSDGKTPAKGVRVHIRPQKTLGDTAGGGLGKRMADTASVVTDSAGRFAFDSTLDTGTYIVEAVSGNDAALIDSVVVKNKAATDTLYPDTLKPAGALKGVIKLSEGGDPRKVFILAFGIDRFARVNADGSFKFSGLAEAKYDLRLISSLDNYGVLDTPNVVVTASETTDLKTIELPFTGIPTPKNVTIAYDTLKQIVTLTWSKADTALVKSYNVYRRNVDSNTVAVRINVSPVADTVYRDSTGVQDQTYEYLIAAVNKGTTEGTKSTGRSVKVVEAYSLSDTILTLAEPTFSMKVFAGKIYVAVAPISSDSGKLQIYDLDGNLIKEWKIPRGLYKGDEVFNAIDVANENSIFIVNRDNDVIHFDSTGVVLDSLHFEFNIRGIAVSDSNVYLGNSTTQAITKSNAKGQMLSTIGSGKMENLGSFAINADGDLLVADNTPSDAVENKVLLLKSDGSAKAIVSSNSILASICVSDSLIYLVQANDVEHTICVYTLAGQLVTKFNVPKDTYSIASANNGKNIYVIDYKTLVIFSK